MRETERTYNVKCVHAAQMLPWTHATYLCICMHVCMRVYVCMCFFILTLVRLPASTRSRSRRNVTAAAHLAFLRFFTNFPYYLFRSAPIGFLSYYCETFGKFSRWHRRCHRSLVRVSLSYSCLSFHRGFTLLVKSQDQVSQAL